MGGSIASPPPPTVNKLSNIIQVDGSDTIQSMSDGDATDSDDSNLTDYNTDDEIDPDMTPISITLKKKPSQRNIKLSVHLLFP